MGMTGNGDCTVGTEEDVWSPPGRILVPKTLRWRRESDGSWGCSGEDWSAIVRPRARGYEVVFTGFGEEGLIWPPMGEAPRTLGLCKAWVRRAIARAADRQRWMAYIGRPSPKRGVSRQRVPRPPTVKRATHIRSRQLA